MIAFLICAATLSFAAHRVDASWQPSPTSGVDHYKVYRSLVPGGPYQLLGIVTAPKTTFTNGSNPDGTPLQEGQTYCYVVTSVLGELESVKSNEVCVVIPVAPLPPTGLTATAH